MIQAITKYAKWLPFFLVLIFCVNAFAQLGYNAERTHLKSLNAIGYGETRAIARRNASINLAQIIVSEVESEVLTSHTVNDDQVHEKSEIKNKVSTQMKFQALDYEDLPMQDNLYSVKAILTPNALESTLKGLLSNVENIEVLESLDNFKLDIRQAESLLELSMAKRLPNYKKWRNLTQDGKNAAYYGKVIFLEKLSTDIVEIDGEKVIHQDEYLLVPGLHQIRVERVKHKIITKKIYVSAGQRHPIKLRYIPTDLNRQIAISGNEEFRKVKETIFKKMKYYGLIINEDVTIPDLKIDFQISPQITSIGKNKKVELNIQISSFKKGELYRISNINKRFMLNSNSITSNHLKQKVSKILSLGLDQLIPFLAQKGFFSE
jgi:hypothetical protein